MQELQKAVIVNSAADARKLADAHLKSRARRVIAENETALRLVWDADAGKYTAAKPPETEQLPQLDVRIGVHDEKWLRWLFNEALSSLTASAMGPMMEQAARANHRDVPCRTCWDDDINVGISWGIDIKTGKDCRACNGTGRTVTMRTQHPAPKFATECCRDCRGSGCETCDGAGSIAKLDVSMSEDFIAAGRTPADKDLENFGRMSRKLEWLPLEHRLTLTLFYGETGERLDAMYAKAVLDATEARQAADKARRYRERKFPKSNEPVEKQATDSIEITDSAQQLPERIFELYPRTTSGRAIVAEARLKSKSAHSIDLSDAELLETEWAAEGRSTKQRRAGLFKRADGQARTMLAAAGIAWRDANATAGK